MKNIIFEDGKKTIPDNEAKFIWPIITKKSIKAINNQLFESISIYNKSGIFKEFEDKFASYHGVKYGLLFNSGTSAIHGMLEGLNLNPKDEIICPVYTFFATCSPAAYLGFNLIFCDSDENGNIDPKEIERKITTQTKVILITHMWGNPCQMDEIIKIKEKYKLILLEDCSHAHGAKYKDKPVGSFGDAAAWSLQGQKIITGGEGGILLTNNQEIYYRANLLGHYNKRCKDEIPKNHNLYKYAITGFGLKLRAHPLAIALANEQFDNLDNWIQQKNIYVKKIIKELKNIPFLSFLNNSNTVPSYYGLIIKYDSFLANNISRENFVDKLHKEGLIEVDIPNSTSPIDQYEIFTHPKASSFRQNATSNQKLKIEAFPQAYKFFNSILKIPIWVRKQDKNIIDLYIQGFKKISKTIMKNYKSNLENIISIELKKLKKKSCQTLFLV